MAALALVLLGATAAPTEEAVSVPISGGSLSGTLMVPGGAHGRVPVALIIAGSGDPDRDGNDAVLHESSYQKLAQGLASSGIATLRYDKRMVGQSRTNQTESALRFDDYVNDALALAKTLERDPRFGTVAIIGHSEGSLVGMIAAQRDPHINAFVSLEGAGRNLATVINEQVAAQPGTPPAIVKEVTDINASLVAGKTVPNPDPLLAALFRPSVQPFVISEYRYNPQAEIAKLSIPVLIISGTHDIQIGEADARDLMAADPKAKLTLIDGMSHVLVDAPLDRAENIAAYSQSNLPLDDKLVPQIASFIHGVHS